MTAKQPEIFISQAAWSHINKLIEQDPKHRSFLSYCL